MDEAGGSPYPPDSTRVRTPNLPTAGLALGTVATAPFVARPPSPPYIPVPSRAGEGKMAIVPSYEDADATMLKEEDLRIITQNKTQIAADLTHNWTYDMRREAQRILDFLYLGPWSAARDKEFLKREGITMLLAARDSNMAQLRLMNVKNIAAELGIVADSIDVTGNQELVRCFPQVVSKINDHLLSVYRSQAADAGAAGPGQIVIDQANFRQGKVLVFCETGNERSALLVAAYIMTLFSKDLVKVIQFINLQRFCASFDEEVKNWLRAYQDILEAKRAVAKNNRQMGQQQKTLQQQQQQQQLLKKQQQQQPRQQYAPIGIGDFNARKGTKRNIDDMFDTDDEKNPRQNAGEMQLMNGQAEHDIERYEDRQPFLGPFADHNKDEEMMQED